MPLSSALQYIKGLAASNVSQTRAEQLLRQSGFSFGHVPFRQQFNEFRRAAETRTLVLRGSKDNPLPDSAFARVRDSVFGAQYRYTFAISGTNPRTGEKGIFFRSTVSAERLSHNSAFQSVLDSMEGDRGRDTDQLEVEDAYLAELETPGEGSIVIQ